MPSDLPTGTVTFLFTDIEGSTRLLKQVGPGLYAEALAEHRRVLRDTIARARPDDFAILERIREAGVEEDAWACSSRVLEDVRRPSRGFVAYGMAASPYVRTC